MKSLHICKPDFDDILYPLIGTIPTKGGASELNTVIKILDKLEERSSADTDETISQAVGMPVLFKMNDAKARFSFEDAEASIVVDRLEEGMKSLSPLRARVIPGLIEQLSEEEDTPEQEDA